MYVFKLKYLKVKDIVLFLFFLFAFFVIFRQFRLLTFFLICPLQQISRIYLYRKPKNINFCIINILYKKLAFKKLKSDITYSLM